MNISTLKVTDSRANQIDANNIQFGKTYSDHMLIADYENGQWLQPQIVPYGDISMSPATSFIHYGQAIFEGVKAYKNPQGGISIFRPRENWERFNVSAARMAMPDVPEDIFVDGMKHLIMLDKDWVPTSDGCSLYIRPFMFATDEFIGVKPAERFRFMIITSPAGAYYNKPTRIYLQKEYIRAFPGGIGFTKAAGNYGACMLPSKEIKAEGYDQILWVDGVEHKYVQEIGTMNVFFVLGDTVITPDLTEGTILAGVTRASVIELLKDKGIAVEERKLSIDEILAAHQRGELREAFGTGTAAVIAPIIELNYEGNIIQLPAEETWTVSSWLKTELADIRYGRKPDNKHWMYKVL
jgi:branched-chain amino acid aminotransferase